MDMVSGTLLLLLVLQAITPQLSAAAPVVVEGNGPAESEGDVPAPAGGIAYDKEEELSPDHTSKGEEQLSVDPRALATALLGALSLPKGKERQEGGGLAGSETVQMKDEEEERRKRRSESEEGGLEQDGKEMQSEEEMNKEEEEEEEARLEEAQSLQNVLQELEGHNSPLGTQGAPQLHRAARGYFPNIDLGLQDNEILPPLKGYKLYNQEVARAGKKMKWQEEDGGKNQPLYNGLNAAIAAAVASDGFEEELEEEEEEEEEILTREEEEARARAEQEEIRRQVEEAQRNREEEAKLADIASDMLLQYMVKKQGGARYATTGGRRKATMLGTNAIEDKRSEEVEDEDDDIDPQTIDKLIEISSKLHLPADDVVDIISDVEAKKRKKKKKDMPENVPRYRPLMPPPAFIPVSSPYPPPPPQKLMPPPYFSPYPSNPSRKWYKEKSKMKMANQKYWTKPHKQFLAYPSFPFYQKPYRAYYPIYFPSPKPKPKPKAYYSKSPMSLDAILGNSMTDYDFLPPKQRYRPRKRPAWPRTPYISNYILPHPRTYQALPVPKPWAPPQPRPPPLYYLQAPMTTREEDFFSQAAVEEQDSDEELENFIKKVYLKRRMYVK